MSEAWLAKVKEQLAEVCNGAIDKSLVSKGGRYMECKMKNGVVTVGVASDGTRMLGVVKQKGKEKQRISMESLSDDMVITRSLGGSIEFLHLNGENPSVRIEQFRNSHGENSIGEISIFSDNQKTKTSLYGYIDLQG